MKCNKCNHILPDDSEFCQYCGEIIEIEKETAEKEIIKEDESLQIENYKKEDKKTKEKAQDKRYWKEKITKIKYKKIILAVAIIFTMAFTVCAINYINTAEKVENKLAIHLSKEYGSNYSGRFMEFGKTYCVVELSGLKYKVEISGSALCGTKRYSVPFFAEAKVNSITGKVTLEKIIFDGSVIK